jgi:hypothetical protein
MRCRRRRTSPSIRGQLIDSQSRASPSGPFTSAATPSWRPTYPSVPGLRSPLSSQAHLTRVSTLSGPGSRPYPASCGRRPAEGQSLARFPVAFRPPAFASQVIRPSLGNGPSLRSAYRPRHHGRIPSGFPRCTRTRCNRGGCLLYLGGGGARPADKKSPAGACRFPAASPCTPPDPIGEAHA